jgi:integrase
MNAFVSTTKIDHASINFSIDEIPLPKFSLPMNDRVGCSMFSLPFLLEKGMRYNSKWRTTEKAALNLAVWEDYLHLQGVDPFDADERHLKRFLLRGGRRTGNIIPFKDSELTVDATNVRKLYTILACYDFWERKRGLTLKKYAGSTLGSLADSLFTRKSGTLSTTPFKFSRAQESKTKKTRKTPSDSDAQRIIARANSDNTSENRRETWFLIASLMRHSGFRAGGCSTLTIASILEGFREEGEFLAIPECRTVLRRHYLPENRKLILKALKNLTERGRKYLFFVVIEKTGFRDAPISIKLLEDILDYIWTTRADFVKERFNNRQHKAPDEVFLSYKNRAFSQESISNKLGKIFSDCFIPGSGHKLRAAFCQALVKDVYLRHRSIHGRAWQASMVLERARQMMGHQNVETLQPYLDDILAEEAELEGEPVVIRDSSDAADIRGISEALDEGNESLKADLKAVMEKHCVSPIAEPASEYAVI